MSCLYLACRISLSFSLAMPTEAATDDTANTQDSQFDQAAYIERLTKHLLEVEAWTKAGRPMPKPWSPPEDPDKPDFPFLPGFSAEIRRHHVGAQTALKPLVTGEYLKTMTHSEAVVLEPPSDAFRPKDAQSRMVAGRLVYTTLGEEVSTTTTTTTADPSTEPSAETAHLAVTAALAVGAARGPQVVACTVTPCQAKGSSEPPRPFQAAAKIFDPLYYRFAEADYPRDCVSDAEKDHRTETAAYSHLIAKDPHHKDPFSPEYYGSWTFTLPITMNGQSRTRDVHLVLIELLNGTTIESMRVHNTSLRGTDAFHYPKEYRLEVLARALEGYARQLESGLNQNDFAGRNIMLVTTPPTNTEAGTVEPVGGLAMPRVVLIDYNIAWIAEPSSESDPDHPAELGRDLDLWEQFGGWVPNDWEEWHEREPETGTNRLKMEWIRSRFPRLG